MSSQNCARPATTVTRGRYRALRRHEAKEATVDDVLMSAPLFAALDDEAAAALRASMEERRLLRGDILFPEGDPGDRLYVVTEGKVKLARTSADGRENLLAVLGPGEMFGELSLFDPRPAHRHRHRADRGHARSASATTACGPG